MFGLFKKKEPPQEPPTRFPPIPDWQPAIVQPIEQIVDRIRFYTDSKRVLLPDNLSSADADSFARETLSKIFNDHPDMNPILMQDGNILVQYNYPAVNLVLDRIASQHWPDIDRNHQRALATSEVLMTPLGQNVFDAFGKKALFGRCYMFMDALNPHSINIVRKGI
jgi:hypothetical protein